MNSPFATTADQALQEQVTFVKIGHREVELFYNQVTNPKLDASLLQFRPFTSWLEKLAEDPQITIEYLRAKSVDRFGKGGFAEIEVIYKLEGEENTRKEEVFIRGPAIGILIVLNCDGKEYTVVSKAPKMPTGRDYFPEIPAGMIQLDGRVGGNIIDAVKAKTTLEINQNDLINLTREAFGEEYSGFSPIPEASDEQIALFLCSVEVTKEQLLYLMAPSAGPRKDLISVEIVPLSDLWQIAPDAKALCALTIYHSLRESGRLIQFSHRKKLLKLEIPKPETQTTL